MFFADDLDGPLTARNFDKRVSPLRLALMNLALCDLQSEDAEDCVQAAICAAYETMERYNPATGQRGLFYWLRRLLRSARADFFRAVNRRAEQLQPSDEFPPDTLVDSPLDSARQLALWNELGSRLGSVYLSEKQEECLKSWMNGETQSSIGERLHLSQQMVSYHIERACDRLRAPGEIEVSAYADLLFAEGAEATVYHKPVGVWDRRGTAEDRETRRRKGMRNQWSTKRILNDLNEDRS